MSFKYCRAYSWPYNSDRWSISEAYFEKIVKNVKELESKLPCDFAIIFAYEEKEFPFVMIALDIDYHLVADSEISQILDDYKTKLGDPTPASIENPGWFNSVDANYSSTLASCGITLLEGEFYKNIDGTNPEVGHSPKATANLAKSTVPSETDIQNLVSHILRPDNPFANIETSNDSENKTQLNANDSNDAQFPPKKWWQFWKTESDNTDRHDTKDENDSDYDNSLEVEWYEKSRHLEAVGKFEEALSCCDKALDINPRYSDAWFNKGIVVHALGNTEEAIGCYDKAIEFDPQYATAWNNKGKALKELGMLDEAMSCYDKALEIDPNQINPYMNKGFLARTQGDIQPIDKDKLITTKYSSKRAKDFSKKRKKCLKCNAKISRNQLKCRACGSDKFIWE